MLPQYRLYNLYCRNLRQIAAMLLHLFMFFRVQSKVLLRKCYRNLLMARLQPSFFLRAHRYWVAY